MSKHPQILDTIVRYGILGAGWAVFFDNGCLGDGGTAGTYWAYAAKAGDHPNFTASNAELVSHVYFQKDGDSPAIPQRAKVARTEATRIGKSIATWTTTSAACGQPFQSKSVFNEESLLGLAFSLVLVGAAGSCGDESSAPGGMLAASDRPGDSCCDASGDAGYLDLVRGRVVVSDGEFIGEWEVAGDIPQLGDGEVEPTWEIRLIAPNGVVNVRVARRERDHVFIRRFGRGRNRSSDAPELFEAGRVDVVGRVIRATLPLEEFTRIAGDVRVTAATYRRFRHAIGYDGDDQEVDTLELGVIGEVP